MEQILVFSLPHISSAYFGDIPPVHDLLYILSNGKEVAVALSVLALAAEVVVAVVVAHVAKMKAKLVEVVMVVYQFKMEMAPLMVSLSLEKL